eukprot:CAMPEP_0114658388 /NCGR_PEP_ID=MMETSP0191-20121206/15653_1 /TAXON_ID=126664 /ORGANISM="Sorites sp." /LENGTH=227 /DNA_ID=CAMNT_0001880271 /DNA_START=581 /DNA_END=1261 /DNA_ORIENTATION=-
MTGKGYFGGQPKAKESSGIAYQGQSYTGNPTMSVNNNYGGGGAGHGSPKFGSTGGGGGGYGTRGDNGETLKYRSNTFNGGIGGDTYGDPSLKVLHLGSGGGSGHPSYNYNGYKGGNGGGAIKIITDKLVIEKNGWIICDGESGSFVRRQPLVSGNGGGSGGSIHIICEQLENDGVIRAKGGKGSDKGKYECSNGGKGGYGRIRIDYPPNCPIFRPGTIEPEIGYSKW